MTKQDMMNELEFTNYIINLSNFAKKYNMQLADIPLFDIALESFPKIEDKIITLKNQIGINVEDVLNENDMETLFPYLNKLLNAYHKRFNLIASKILYEKEVKQIFYVDFTIKKEYARKLLNLNKNELQQIQQLENVYFLNIETVSELLKINQDELQYLIDCSITNFNENFKDK